MKPLSILVVDDEKVICKLVKKVLIELGHDVTLSGDASGAIESLKEFTHDVVITDLNMIGMNGHGLTEHIKENHPNVRVVVMSGGVEKTKYCHAFLPKPFIAEELQFAIESALK